VTLYGLLAFGAVYALTVASPGPGVAAVIARGLAHGMKGTPSFIGGFLVGDLVWFGIAATGLAALARTAATLFVAIKWAGVAYLLYLAWKLWTAPAERVEVKGDDREHGWRAFMASFLLTLGNPKAILFYSALLPTFLDMTRIHASDFLILAAIVVAVSYLVYGTYIFIAERSRRLLSSTSASRLFNRLTGTVLIGAGIAVAAR